MGGDENKGGEGFGQARQGERSELCDGGLKVIEKERMGGEENKGGEGLRAASASLT